MVAEAVPAVTHRLLLPELHETQWQVANHPARFKVIPCGRGWGKSAVALILCVEAACNTSNSAIWYVGPSHSEVSLQWRDLQTMMPECDLYLFRESDRRMVFANGSEVAFKSAHVGERNLRGGQRRLVVVDEAASIADGAYIWMKALRPSLTRYQGRALFIGTPRGNNWFKALYDRGQDPAQPDWASFIFPSSANPYLPPEDIEQARQELPDAVFRQEYLAEFITDGAVFRNIRGCVGDTAAFGQPLDGKPVRVVFGVDWAKHHDFTVVVGIDCARRLARVLERGNQVSYSMQRDRLAALHKRWNPDIILAESNAMGEPIIEQLQRDQLPVMGFMTTASSKPAILEALMLVIEQGRLTYSDQGWDATMIAELESYTMTRQPSGRFSFSAPPGGHDDCVMALAIAEEALTKRTRIGEWSLL